VPLRQPPRHACASSNDDRPHERHDTPAAVLFVDLDGLKMLNDSFGHEGGDAALIQVAELLVGGRARERLRRAARRRRILHPARPHADEKSAIETAERLVDLIAGCDFLFEGTPMPLSVAIGVTLIERGDTPATVLARADRRCTG
jgi:diguanylate cyclase (GGDEF)-like protein